VDGLQANQVRQSSHWSVEQAADQTVSLHDAVP
jgi:hypothetical protein